MQNHQELDYLYKLKKEVEKSDHYSLVNMINEMIKKVYLNQFTLTFIGHFSAGKSTVINRLLGKDILPSSPVPTTSNTVQITVAEDDHITANLENQQYAILSNYDDVKQMNKENYNVESIDIHFKADHYNHGLTFQDTPGVDSNVKNHSLSTEMFLYTSNFVFYTVDYNHVQSSLNFKFMRRLNQANVPVVFIINQIDKHNDDEISFETFQNRVQQSLKEWDIEVEDIFYITKYDHPHNQYNALQTFIHDQDQHRETVSDYVSRVSQLIKSEQSNYLENEMDSILERLNIQADEFDEAYQRHQHNQEVNQESELINDPNALSQFLNQKRKKIINNAYIMTHSMREHIRYYLESMTKDFKVGGLFNKKKKTELERDERLTSLMSELQNSVNQEIINPMQNDLSFLTRYINDEETNQRILNQQMSLSSSLVTELYQTQVSISNQYVLTFSEDLMKNIRQFILNESEPLDQTIVDNVHADSENGALDQDTTLYQRFEMLQSLKTSLETENYQHYYIHMDDSLDRLIDRQQIDYHPTAQGEAHEVEQQPTQTKQHSTAITSTAEIEAVLTALKNIPLFQNTIDNIHNMMQRMHHQTIKIGVFGTFSAGKSSLINALLGDRYLTSSPNPTTAATTELTYGDQSSITFKSPEQLLQEINHVTQVAQQQFDSIDAFLNFDTAKIKEKVDKDKIAFLEAVEKNYQLYADYIQNGVHHTIPEEEVQKWSAEDQFATFVNTVHLELPIPFLKNIILIDSLGLHSNNQRHTNETEKILTTSDLIIYVSYFNHAFTDNDKLFIEHMKDLNQLKEAQTFKMVVNAIDLAETVEDKEAVMNYVENELANVQLTPEIYGVSSRNALQSKDEGIDSLKQSIQHFKDIESKEVIQNNINHQLNYIKASYETMINDYKQNAEALAQNKQTLERFSEKGILNIRQIIQSISQKVTNEIDEQIHYFNERLNIQLLDDIKSYFNSQMTQTKDFQSEKRHTSQHYLNQIQQKLYLEQSLIVERIKHFYHKQIEFELIPIVKQLQEHHIIAQSQLNLPVEMNDIDNDAFDIEAFMKRLPKTLTQKHIIQPKHQKVIHESIKETTIELIQPLLDKFQQQLMQLRDNLNTSAEEQLNALETNVQKEISNHLDFTLDDQLIVQLEDVLPQLHQITEEEIHNE